MLNTIGTKNFFNFNTTILALFVFIFVFVFIFSTAVSAYASLNCTSSPCTTTECKCTTNCTTGYFNIYPTSECAGVPKKKLIIDIGNITFAPTATTYAKILCADQTVSTCYSVNLSQVVSNVTTTTTTTRTATTTSTIIIQNCPYNCCVNQAGYKNKFCPAGQSCTNNVCIDLKSDCPDEYDCCVDEADYKDKFCETTDATCTDEHKCAGAGATINYSLIGILAAAIVVGVVLFYFLSGRTSGVTGMKLLDAYEALKRKWRGRLTHLYRKRSK